jgi:DNA-3-methyladenine glycosylase I
MGATVNDGRQRCSWCGDDAQYVAYHDTEWGVPTHGDHALFELLTLEGAQAGLSWLTILRRREGYRRVFAKFDPLKVAHFSDKKIEEILLDPGVVRHRQKVASVVSNARAILRIQEQNRSLDDFLWEIGAEPGEATVRARTMSKRLGAEGLKFVGPTICLSFMQASGMINDHAIECFRYAELLEVQAGRSLRPRQ